MAGDPFACLRDAPLFIVPRTLDRLRAFRDGPRLAGLPALAPLPERERLALLLDELAARLLAGIEAHPTRSWVLKQFQQSLQGARHEDAGARALLGHECTRLMDILGIEDAAGLLPHYLGQPGARA